MDAPKATPASDRPTGPAAPRASGAAVPATGRRRASARRWLLTAIGVLYVFSVPWYRQPDPDPPLWLGLPSWVTVALLCYAAAAVLNAFAWFWTPVDDDARIALGGGPAEARAEDSR